MSTTEKAAPRLTPSMVLMAMQKTLMAVAEAEADGDFSEPFPIELTELFLYSPDGMTVLLVFPFLGQDFVLSETEISTERDGQVMVINDPLKMKILEYLIFRIKLIRELTL